MYKRKKGQAISKAKKYTYNGVEYKSGLEACMARLLTEEGIYFGYETKSFILQESFDTGREYFERQSNGKGEYMLRSSLVRSITYTPDFVLEGAVVETKGYSGESFPLRYKMFKNHVKNLDLVLYKPQNQKECERTLQEILKREIWKPVVGYEGYYEVSNYGRIKSLPRVIKQGTGHRTSVEKILKPSLDGSGYPFVELCVNEKGTKIKVHRLVMLAFCPDGQKETINHKDEIKTNNGLSNLEWMSRIDNIRYSYNKPVLQFSLAGEFLKEYPSTKSTEIDGFIQSAVSNCCTGKVKTHKGFKWQYKEDYGR